MKVVIVHSTPGSIMIAYSVPVVPRTPSHPPILMQTRVNPRRYRYPANTNR